MFAAASKGAGQNSAYRAAPALFLSTDPAHNPPAIIYASLTGAMVGYEISHALIAPWYAPKAVAPFRTNDAFGVAAAWTF